MLELLGSTTRNCDGIARRDFVKVGALAAGGWTLVDQLRAEARAAEDGSKPRRKAVIQIYQAGGPSHIDMYDLKPTAPAEYRGEFKEIDTNVQGIRISEHLPLQARVMDKLAIVRSATHTNPGHGMGSQWMMTGWQPAIEINDNLFPSCGSIVSRLKGPNTAGLPAYVNLPSRVGFGKAAYLGASYNPFSPDNDPNQQYFNVRNLQLPGRVPVARLDKRRALLGDLDSVRRDVDAKGDMTGLDKFYRDAMEMVTNDAARDAFDIHKEDPRLRDNYGRNDLGQSCLLARRLVEAGVTYVTIQAGGGWDTHGDNFAQLKNNLLPKFDRAVASLVEDLSQRGMLDDVLVMCFGEFGRTPRINPTSGRDHWPGAMSVLFSGGGLKLGQVVGATDSRAEYPTTNPQSPGCILSTMYHSLGVDYKHEFYDAARRPMAVLAEGKPIAELV
jgi:hypothetical protein